MEKKINKKALLLSLAFALISCFLVFHYISKLSQPAEKQEKTQILVASRNISSGETIKAEDIHSMDVSEDSIPAGILNDRKSIEGFVAREPIVMGEPFRQERVAEQEQMSLSYTIPEGMRAISIFVNENTVFSNQLRVGDKVDVIGNFKKETPDGKTIASSRIILQNVEVLAIGPERFQKNDPEPKISEDGSNLPKTVTLCVTPGDSEKMAFTTAFGDFTLALRGQKDEEKVNTPGTIIEHVTPF